MESLLHVPLKDIKPDPEQPRKHFDKDALRELADSIRAKGVVQPILVRKNPEGDTDYMIIAGERRWQASQIAGIDTIPAVLVTDSEKLSRDEIYSTQLTENFHRQDLNPVEKAEFIQDRIDFLKEQGETNCVELVAQELGVSKSWVSKNTQILKYSEDLRALARGGKLRDYSILKKLDSLKGDRREEAIQQIERGDFVAKDFFARKRYDKKKPAETAEQDLCETDQAVSHEKPKAVTVSFKHEDVIRLIGKTDYAAVLENHDSNWQNADPSVMSQYVDQFKEWVRQAD